MRAKDLISIQKVLRMIFLKFPLRFILPSLGMGSIISGVEGVDHVWSILGGRALNSQDGTYSHDGMPSNPCVLRTREEETATKTRK